MTPEQRTQWVLRLLGKEELAAQIARRAGISEQTLYRWRDEFISGGQHALNGRGAQAEQAKVVERLQSEIAEREQVIRELTIANRIFELSVKVREMIRAECMASPGVRLNRVLKALKVEEVYWKLYTSPGEARESLEIFRQRYNEVRRHWTLIPPGGGDPVTPADLYVHGQAVGRPKWQGWAKATKEKLRQMTEGAHFPVKTSGTPRTSAHAAPVLASGV